MEAHLIKQWNKRWTTNGVELTPCESPTAGYVHVAPRIQSIRSARAIIEAAREELARHARDVKIVRADRVVTNEGENAVRASLTAIAADHLIGRELGIVFTDDFIAVIDAAFNDRHNRMFRDFVDRLVRDLPLYSDRKRRRIEFSPPPSWAPRSRGLFTHLFAPSYSADGTFLSVLPAEPRGLDSMIKTIVYEDFPDGFELTDHLPNAPIICPSGLAGNLVSVRGRIKKRPIVALAAILYDRNYRYVVRLESHREIDPEDVILPVVRSIRPVPDRAVTTSTLGAEALSHYAE